MTATPETAGPSAPSGRDVIAQFLPQSPVVVKLGMVADRLEEHEVRLGLPCDRDRRPAGHAGRQGAGDVQGRLRSLAADGD
jgi:hypothetical protein